MRKVVPVLVAVGLIILIVVGFVGFQVLDRYMPTKERADLAEVYDVSGDETAILYNYERQEQTGIYENGQTYLPVSWVNDHINERFYWDSMENLLVYALPDQIVYADAETKGSNGAPLLLVKDEEVYLTLGLIANYTDVQIQTFFVAEQEALRQLAGLHHDLAVVAGIVDVLMQRCGVAAFIGPVEEQLHRVDFYMVCRVKFLIFFQFCDLFRQIPHSSRTSPCRRSMR